MWSDLVPAGSTWLPISALGAITAAVVAMVAAWRKWKAGEIEDDGILLQRVLAEITRKDQEIETKSKQSRAKDNEIDELRKRLRRAEDAGAIYRRQLIENNIVPAEVPS